MKIAIVGDPHLSEGFRCRTDNYLETVLGKIDYIASQNDKVIFLGDLFHKCANSTLFFNTVYKFFSKPEYEGKFISILGNHDTAFRNEKALDRTTIGSLELTGVLKIVRDTFTIDNATFDVSSCKKDLSKLGDPDNYKILLGHNYYNMMDCLEESFTEEEVRKLNYNMVFLGHEHVGYEPERIGNTTLYRSGSLSRFTSDSYNETRKIYYYQLDSVTLDCIKSEIPSKSIEECYIEGAFSKSSSVKRSNYAGLSALLSRFDKRVDAGKIEMPKVIKKLGGKEEHITYLREVHRDNNLRFD